MYIDLSDAVLLRSFLSFANTCGTCHLEHLSMSRTSPWIWTPASVEHYLKDNWKYFTLLNPFIPKNVHTLMLILFASEHFAENNFSLQQSKAARQFWWNLSRKSIVGKTFEEKILIRTLSTTLLQISREIIFNPEVVVRSIIDPDNIDQYEWIHLLIPVTGQKSPECYVDIFPQHFTKIIEGEMLIRTLQTFPLVWLK